jgi:two-component system, chemotaxis family, protein-glutamate methylesterase/glutaminase
VPPSRDAAGQAMAGPPVVVAVVAGTRTRIKALERLLTQPGLVLGGSAQDPESAENLVQRVGPSAVLLDLDLWSGGLETIERIMAVRATPIVVIGSAAEHPEAAIAAGAVDVVGALDVAPGTAEYAQAVMRHLKVASRVRVITHPRGRLRNRAAMRADPWAATDGAEASATASGLAPADRPAPGPTATPRRDPVTGPVRPAAVERSSAERARLGPRIIAIGASTGGPPALATILTELPADLPAAVVVVQHMAEGFVEGLARWLDGICPLPVMVAVEGERIQPGHVYLAPANQNLVLRPGFRVGLADPPPGQYHVPGVDVTFRSIASLAGGDAIGVLLTGMGRDGAAGLRVMRDAGSFTIGQDESTSVVWGMPAAAQELDAVDVELPLPAIGRAMVAAVVDASDERQHRAEPSTTGGRS